MYQSYEQLLNRRSRNGKPHFWNPTEIKKVPHTLIFDEDLDCESEWNVNQAIQRTLALGLFLELPVGEWVMEGRKTNLPTVAKKLLQTNIADEAKHFLGFSLANKSYPIDKSVMDEAGLIAQAWLDSTEHPLIKARNAETGVFLAGGLAILRLAGGTSLADMAESIAVDESGHVAANNLVLADLNMSPYSPSLAIRELIDSTIDWLVGDLSIPGRFLGERYNFDKKFVMESSKELIETGVAKRLNDLLDIQVTQSPMEQSNSSLYSRVFE